MTGVDPASPRFPQAIVALNGRATPKTGVIKEPGIRHLFWLELVRFAEARPADAAAALAALSANQSEQFEIALARAIRVKAGMYREKFPRITLSPKALRDWWLDLENQAAGDSGLTPEQMERFA